jgi:hypothetical protein
MGFLGNLKGSLNTSGELLKFFMQNKWWWLVPMVAILLIFGALIVLAETSAIGPFIYSLF